jgi:hypothetical protein
MNFLENPNSITFTTVTYGFLSMVLVSIIGCCFRMKCNEVEMCKCFKMTRDITAENEEMEIERRNRDIIPSPDNV